MDQIQAWSDSSAGGRERPLFSRLPKAGYGDNSVADALTKWVDQTYVAKKRQLERFHLELSPDTCADETLDYLASLAALSDSYWDTRWLPSVKRQLLTHVSFLMRRRGTFAAIETVLRVHGIDYKLWTEEALLLPFQMPKRFGGSALRYYLRLPLTYPRLGAAFKEAQRTLRNYGSAFTRSGVAYEWYYMGYSLLGDPMFQPPAVLPAATGLTARTYTARDFFVSGVQPVNQWTLPLPPKPATSSTLPYAVTSTTESGGTIEVIGSNIRYVPPVGFFGTDRARVWLVGDRRQSTELTFETAPAVILDRYETTDGNVSGNFRVPLYSRYGDGFLSRWNRSAAGGLVPSSVWAFHLLQGRSRNYALRVTGSVGSDGQPLKLTIAADNFVPNLVAPSTMVAIDIYRTAIAVYSVDNGNVVTYLNQSGLGLTGGTGTVEGAGWAGTAEVEVRGDNMTIRVQSHTFNLSIPGLRNNRGAFHGIQAPGSLSFAPIVQSIQYYEF